MESDLGGAPVVTTVQEYVLWTLQKGEHVAEARTRMDPSGPVLAFYIDNKMAWHERFPDGRGAVLGEVAEAKWQELVAAGWTAA